MPTELNLLQVRLIFVVDTDVTPDALDPVWTRGEPAGSQLNQDPDLVY